MTREEFQAALNEALATRLLSHYGVIDEAVRIYDQATAGLRSLLAREQSRADTAMNSAHQAALDHLGWLEVSRRRFAEIKALRAARDRALQERGEARSLLGVREEELAFARMELRKAQEMLGEARTAEEAERGAAKQWMADCQKAEEELQDYRDAASVEADERRKAHAEIARLKARIVTLEKALSEMTAMHADAAAKACRNETERDALACELAGKTAVEAALCERLKSCDESREVWKAAYSKIRERLSLADALAKAVEAFVESPRTIVYDMARALDAYLSSRQPEPCTHPQGGTACGCEHPAPGPHVVQPDPPSTLARSERYAWFGGELDAALARWIASDKGQRALGVDVPAAPLSEGEKAAKRIADLEDFVRDIRDNYDCDENAHQYRTRCRCCEAEKLLPKKEQ